MDQQELERLVAQVKQALADRQKPSMVAPSGRRDDASPLPRLVTEAIVAEAARTGTKVLRIAPGAIITPLARDALRKHGIALASALPGTGDVKSGTDGATGETSSFRPRTVHAGAKGRVALGVIPAARSLEQAIAASVRGAGLIPLRVPSPVREAAHLARQVAGAVSGGEATMGIIVDEIGHTGPAVANRVQGVIAATCHDPLSARWARERLGANVLCLAAEVVAPALLHEIVVAWISSPAKTPSDVAAVLRELDRR